MTIQLKYLLSTLKKTPMETFEDNWEYTKFNIAKSIIKTFIDNKDILSLEFHLNVYQKEIKDYNNVDRLTIHFKECSKNNYDYIKKINNITTKVNQNSSNMQISTMSNLYREYQLECLSFTAKDSENKFNPQIYKQLNNLLGKKFDAIFNYYYLENTIPQREIIEKNKLKI